MKNALMSLGMNDAFSAGANFSGIKKENDIYIDDVIHKTFINVNEVGTTAAAVTDVEMSLGLAPDEDKGFNMNVNRPFLFFLRNSKFPENHQMLFMCKIESL